MRIDRGLYLPAEEADQDHVAAAAAAIRHPNGVICLISAVRLHGLVPRFPGSAGRVDGGSSWGCQQRITRAIRLLNWAPAHQGQEIETRMIAGVTVRLTDPTQSILDCWRCPHLIGREAALEALP